MKKLFIFASSLLMAVGLFAENGASDLDDVSVAMNTGYTSEYFYRAQKRSQHAVQAKVEMGYPMDDLADVYAGVWTNNPVANEYANEVDIYGGFTYMFHDGYTMDMGYTHNRFMNGRKLSQRRSTNEIYTGVTSDLMFNPAMYVYYDFDLRQVTTDLSAGYKFNLAEAFDSYSNFFERTSIDSGVSVGWLKAARFIKRGGDQKIDYFFASVQSDLVYALNEHVSIKNGVRFAVNSEGRKSPVNAFGGSGALIAYTVSISAGF